MVVESVSGDTDSDKTKPLTINFDLRNCVFTQRLTPTLWFRKYNETDVTAVTKKMAFLFVHIAMLSVYDYDVHVCVCVCVCNAMCAQLYGGGGGGGGDGRLC